VNSRTCARSRDDARVCAELVLRIVQNTRNNLWTGHDDDWNIYSARYARCTLYDGIFVAGGVPAVSRSGITVPYFKHDPPRCLSRTRRGGFFGSELSGAAIVVAITCVERSIR